MEKTERLNLVLTLEESERLKLLANANMGGNKSLMIRSLINMAFMNPCALGLHSAKCKEIAASRGHASVDSLEAAKDHCSQ